MCASGESPSSAFVASAALEAARVDAAAPRCEFWWRPPAAVRPALLEMLNDKRDAPILWLFINVVCTTLPAAAAVAAAGSHAWGAAYLLANYVLHLQRFMLALHYSQHRALFKKEYAWLNAIAPLILSNFMGVPCGLYHLHHCVMHHVGDNAASLDLSSTEPFQRDNLVHFLWYYTRFVLGSFFELPVYAIRRKRYMLAAKCLGGTAAYLAAAWACLAYNPVAATWVLIVPFFVTSAALMFGNWSQHVFIDPVKPGSDFSLTYNVIATSDNTKSFNDGYHVVHHLNSRIHWSEFPQYFMNHLPQHDAEDALVFRGVSFFDVGLAVFSGNLPWLAEKCVPCGPKQAARSKEEWIAVMKARLRPISRHRAKI